MSRNPEQQLYDEFNDLVGHQEEQRRDHDEDEDHAGGDHGLAPGRPGDFRHLGADFADELDRILRRHGSRFFRKWQEWRDSNPRPSVLETDALPTELHSYTTPPAGAGDGVV